MKKIIIIAAIAAIGFYAFTKLKQKSMLDRFKAAWNSTPKDSNWDAELDFNNDGIINGADFSIWSSKQ